MGLSRKFVLRPTDTLAAIKSVDGAGSGLDADLLDGQHAEEIIQAAKNNAQALTSYTGKANAIPLGSTNAKLDNSWIPALNYDPTGSAAAVRTDLVAHSSDAVRHITAAERAAWNSSSMGGNVISADQPTNQNDDDLWYRIRHYDFVWSMQGTPKNNYWTSACYQNDLFVVVGENNSRVLPRDNVIISTDAVNWTIINTPGDVETSGGWKSICYGNGLFVAVGDIGSHSVMTSPDGKHWTLRVSPVGHYQSVCYGKGKFIAITSDSPVKIITSTDGINWTGSSSYINQCYSVACNNSTFIIASYNGDLLYSLDGSSWKDLYPTLKNPNTRVVALSNGDYMILSNSNQLRLGSYSVYPAGWTWETRTIPISSLLCACDGDGLIIAATDNNNNNGNQIILSSDGGLTWRISNDPQICRHWNFMCYGNGILLLGSSDNFTTQFAIGKAIIV